MSEHPYRPLVVVPPPDPCSGGHVIAIGDRTCKCGEIDVAKLVDIRHLLRPRNGKLIVERK